MTHGGRRGRRIGTKPSPTIRGSASGRRGTGKCNRRGMVGPGTGHRRRWRGGVRAALAEANAAYERRFGRIYLVCAAGRSAEELLADVAARMRNDPEREREVAVEEQRKITRLRLNTLIGARDS